MATLLDLTITEATSCNGLALLLREVGVGRLAEGEEATDETFGANNLGLLETQCLGKRNPQINRLSYCW